jgi:hypothetical protein
MKALSTYFISISLTKLKKEPKAGAPKLKKRSGN